MHKSLFKIPLRKFGGGGSHGGHGLPKFDSPTVRTEEATREIQSFNLDYKEPYIFRKLSDPAL